MERTQKIIEPNNTAVRTALWRALHVQIDAQPHILEDEVGFKLIAPNPDWRQRPDMDIDFTRRVRASMVARARFIEDLIIDQANQGVKQYVILGAGLDTFAQRRLEIASKLTVFEIDEPNTHNWKKQRLVELGYGNPEWLRFVSVDFEAGSSWWKALINEGFDASQPAVIACTGLSMYLTREANLATLQQIAALAPGSTLAMTFMLPIELIDEEDVMLQQISEKGARASGNPFISYFTPDEMLKLAREAGFKEVACITAADLAKQYFSGRPDNLSPASGEVFLIAST
ncbi:MAG TPA: class I SAM-dependent methyltransferase [Paludibacter sp.]|nr:class I SAM-dependent methyltransferase [Paludibacter sp.]